MTFLQDFTPLLHILKGGHGKQEGSVQVHHHLSFPLN